jgi:hypothetical protein
MPLGVTQGHYWLAAILRDGDSTSQFLDIDRKDPASDLQRVRPRANVPQCPREADRPAWRAMKQVTLQAVGEQPHLKPMTAGLIQAKLQSTSKEKISEAIRNEEPVLVTDHAGSPVRASGEEDRHR